MKPFAIKIATLVELLFMIGALSYSSAVPAKKLYKYQDENGIWHFSDQAPNTDRPVTVRQMKVERRQKIRLIQGGDRQQPTFSLHNDYGGPVQVEVDFAENNNARSVPELPHRFVVQPGQSDTLLRIFGEDERLGFSVSLRYYEVPGPPLPRYESTHVYWPPLAPGMSFPISQGFGGEFSHNDLQNRYALDIAMPVGTPIHAARAGVVMEAENDFFDGGVKPTYRDRANHIRIIHEDGSMAVYAHLDVDRAQVYPGMPVEAGQLIGYSGNTGFTTGPHLHFVIQYNRGMELVSAPFVFMTRMGQAEAPAVGAWLTGIDNDTSERGRGGGEK
ncbi:MAG: peptidoglycan DD-metalloendopeptidase family protein [Methylomicrobium sp.]